MTHPKLDNQTKLISLQKWRLRMSVPHTATAHDDGSNPPTFATLDDDDVDEAYRAGVQAALRLVRPLLAILPPERAAMVRRRLDVLFGAKPDEPAVRHPPTIDRAAIRGEVERLFPDGLPGWETHPFAR